MPELFDLLIFGAVIYYIVQAVRRAASRSTDRRPPGTIASEGGESLSWDERTLRALEGASEWEEQQQRLEEEAEIREEIEALRAERRGAHTPWSARRDPRPDRHRPPEPDRPVPSLPEPGAPEAPTLSDALATVAGMLEGRTAAGRPATAEHRARSSEGRAVHLPRHGERVERTLTRTEPMAIARRGGARVTRGPEPSPSPGATDATSEEARAFQGGRPARRRTPARPLELPALASLTPLQRAIIYGEIFGRPAALRASGGEGPLD